MRKLLVKGAAGMVMSWLNGKRLSLYPRIFVFVYVAMWGFWILTGSGLTDRMGKPIGSDFLAFFTASSVALRGEPAAAYDFGRISEMERSIVKADYPAPWVYPPTYLLIVLPLGLLPYLASLAAWTASTLTLFLLTLRRIAPHPSTTWLALGFPGTFQNLTHGQNGFLIAALLGGGLLSLERFPLVAGILFGLLGIKPHMAALVLVALTAGRHWKTLGTMILSTGILTLVSGLEFGWSTWSAFLGNINLPLYLLENESSYWGKMITAYGSFRMLGLDSRTSLLLNGVVSIAAAGTVWWIWSRRTSVPVKASSLCLSTLLFSPYAFSYDLAILALPLAWLGWEALRGDWTDWEKLCLAIGWFLPFLSPIIVLQAGIPVVPIILSFLLYIVLRRSGITSLPSGIPSAAL